MQTKCGEFLGSLQKDWSASGMYFYYPDIMFQVQFCIMLQKVKTSLEDWMKTKLLKV